MHRLSHVMDDQCIGNENLSLLSMISKYLGHSLTEPFGKYIKSIASSVPIQKLTLQFKFRLLNIAVLEISKHFRPLFFCFWPTRSELRRNKMNVLMKCTYLISRKLRLDPTAAFHHSLCISQHSMFSHYPRNGKCTWSIIFISMGLISCTSASCANVPPQSMLDAHKKLIHAPHVDTRAFPPRVRLCLAPNIVKSKFLDKRVKSNDFVRGASILVTRAQIYLDLITLLPAKLPTNATDLVRSHFFSQLDSQADH